MVRQAVTGRRSHKLMYFKGLRRRGTPRELRLELQQLITPLDKDAIACFDFISTNVLEMLFFEQYKEDMLDVVNYYGWEHMPDANPLTNFASRYHSSSQPNRMLVNATACYQRVERLLQSVWHPLAKELYTKLSAKAQDQIAKARELGANVPLEEMFQGAKEGGRRNAAGRQKKARRGTIRRGAAADLSTNDAGVNRACESGRQNPHIPQRPPRADAEGGQVRASAADHAEQAAEELSAPPARVGEQSAQR